MTLSAPLVVDFDSTIIRCEALDELAKLVLARSPDRDTIVEEIEATTRAGMDGTISITESLERRLALLSIRRADLDTLVRTLLRSITPSFKRNRAFLKRHADSIHIITSGFREYVVPVIESLGLRADQVHANTFTFDPKGLVTGFDRKSPLAKAGGKIEALKLLRPSALVDAIGDGMTDLEMKQSGLVRHFYAFTENVERPSVVELADRVIRSFDEYLYVNRFPGKTSFPKSKIQVLLLEAIHPDAVEAFKSEGYSVSTLSDALDEDELVKHVRDVSILGIRSKTRVSERVLAAAERLLAVGAFCIGTEQIALPAASQRGVAVFNAPYSNTRSVVELAIGEMIMLLRRSFDGSAALHRGAWQKTASGCYEIRGKKLGIVGYGNIGSQLSVIAESLGLEVHYYDVVEKLALGNARRAASLKELLAKVDIVSIHVDGRANNKELIGDREFALMKKGVIFLNLARGSIVDVDALARAVRSGRVGGAAVDVFPLEPKSNKDPFVTPLQGLPNVILTPHIGGSTLEAQQNIGTYVASRSIDYVNSGNSFGSVNLPQIQLPNLRGAHRFLHIHRNVPGILAKINSVCAANKINILGQYLKTTEEIGYVIIDVNKRHDERVTEELKRIPETIRFRVLY
ncbi:MAG: phosphoglycerate dehydrogenase [Phycisphaerae bacterium]|nr:phosphoglycerate dehydrogenase [Phycisphaerae bacterium]